jgi:hypothetical protein
MHKDEKSRLAGGRELGLRMRKLFIDYRISTFGITTEQPAQKSGIA